MEALEVLEALEALEGAVGAARATAEEVIRVGEVTGGSIRMEEVKGETSILKKKNTKKLLLLKRK